MLREKPKPISIYQPICHSADLTPEIKQTINDYEAALAVYLDGNWDQAQQCFQQLLTNEPDNKLYQLFIQRMNQLDNSSPNYWDSSFERREK